MSKTIYLATDEWYPVWYLEEPNDGTKVEISDDEYNRITEAFIEFEEIQQLLSKLGKGR